MSETADLRQKADTCIRLAAAATSARANELFKRLADEYRAQADALEMPVASPPLSPPADDEAGIAVVASPAVAEIAEVEIAPPVAADNAGMGDDTAAAPCLAPEITPVLTPMPPAIAPASSAQWLAELQALRARL